MAIPNIVRSSAPQAGLDGRTIISKARAPLMTDGRIGDFFIDTAAKKLYGPKNAGAWPDNGLIKGDRGWVPVLAAANDNARRVMRIIDWQGGEGTKPTTTGYLGVAGPTSVLADAIDFRGPQGVMDLGAVFTPSLGVDTTLQSVLDRSIVDVRRYGNIVFSASATETQKNANTKTIGDALLASFYNQDQCIIDLPPGDIYLGSGTASGTIRYNNCLLYIQGCKNVIVRGNGTTIWLPGTDETNYIGFMTMVSNKQVSIAGELTLRLANPAVNQGVIYGYSAGAYIDVELDWMPTWTTVKSLFRWSEDRKPLAFLAARTASGLTMTAQAGGNGNRFRIDISGAGGTIDIVNPSLTAVGQKVSLQHCTYTANMLSSYGDEEVRIGAGVKINDAAGMGIYAQGSKLFWDATIEPPLVNGIPRLLSTIVDGVHVKGCAGGHIRGRIEGTGDDCVNASDLIGAVISGGDTTLRIALYNPNFGSPIKGNYVELIDATGASRGRFFILTRTDQAGSSPTYADLLVSATLPGGIDNTWRAINVSNSENYNVDVIVGYNLGAGLRSSAVSASFKVKARKTRLEAIHQGSFTAVEYAVPRDVVIDCEYEDVNCGIDSLRNGYGVVACRPTRADGSTFVARGAGGTLKVSRLAGHGAKGTLIYAEGMGRVVVSGAVADAIDVSVVAMDGFSTNPAFGQFVNCGSVELYAPAVVGDSPLPIYLSTTTTFKMFNQVNVTAPTTGADHIFTDAKGTGYQIVDGILRQWGFIDGSDSDPVLTFPIPFIFSPGFVTSVNLASATPNFIVAAMYSDLTPTQVTVRRRYIATASPGVVQTSPAQICWMAIGVAKTDY